MPAINLWLVIVIAVFLYTVFDRWVCHRERLASFAAKQNNCKNCPYKRTSRSTVYVE